MAKVLYIKATPKLNEDSWTLKMSEFFIREYIQCHPLDEVTVLSLYDEDIAFLSERDLYDMMQADKGEFANYVDQFLQHDKYVIAAPFWNGSFPAIFKAYLDRIITVGKTFSYTDEGIKPILSGRPSLFFMARGGVYSEGPLAEFEFGWRYWQAIATTFLGLDTKAHLLEGTEVFAAEEVEKAFQRKLCEIKAEAALF
jgi:FMN-dependent NADH-azoreductase